MIYKNDIIRQITNCMKKIIYNTYFVSLHKIT